MVMMSSPSVRRAATAFVALYLWSAALPLVQAAEWPTEQSIQLLVPSAAGGTPDRTSRKLASYLQERLHQTVLVDNRPGGSGVIAMQAVAVAKPDGYTLGFGNVVTMAIGRHLVARLPYDPDKAFTPVAVLTQVPNLLVVRRDLPVKSVQELIAFAKAHPDKLSMGSGGNGTTSHLSGEILKQMTGISFAHIPYRGAPQAQTDLLGGQVDFMFDNFPSMIGAVQNGKLRALAVTSKTRVPMLPDVPTMDEAGLKGFEVMAWGGVVVPAGTPRPIVMQLNREINTWLHSREMRAEFLQMGNIPMEGGTPEFFKAHIERESRKWAEVIRKGRVKLE